MLFKFSLNERNITILAFTFSFLVHAAFFGCFSGKGDFKGENISKEPLLVEIVSAPKKEEILPPVVEDKVEEVVPPPEPQPEQPPEKVEERKLEEHKSSLPSPPMRTKEKKKALKTEKKGNVPSISPLIAKTYEKQDKEEGVQVPPVPEENKVPGAPPAVIQQPVMGKAFGKGTGALEDIKGDIKEVAFGGSFGPSFKNMVKPEYPDFARRSGKEGYVLLKVLLDEYGRVKKVEVLQSAGSLFDQSAVAAIKKSTFHPARENGVPIPCYVKIPIRFQLVHN